MVQRGLNKEMYVCKSVYWSRQHSPEHGCDLNIFSAVKVTLAGGVSNYWDWCRPLYTTCCYRREAVRVTRRENNSSQPSTTDNPDNSDICLQPAHKTRFLKQNVNTIITPTSLHCHRDLIIFPGKPKLHTMGVYGSILLLQMLNLQLNLV